MNHYTFAHCRQNTQRTEKGGGLSETSPQPEVCHGYELENWGRQVNESSFLEHLFKEASFLDLYNVWHYTGASVGIRAQGEHKAQRDSMSELSERTQVGVGGDEPGSGPLPDRTYSPALLPLPP